ncbi:dermonecrotic toxin domain-containing protein [Pseudomonas cedrina]|uniref:dermonecrotic toxin domain-containing protein n=1 Tax=Pseudomonas cedrina TaxID=651740 RepID=UPI003EDAC79B
MAKTAPPYFFNEFLRTISREAPTQRERELGLSLIDLDWMHTLYYATDDARRSPQLRKTPMAVETLWINVADKPAVQLAGAFMMSPSPDASKALLYTPYGGIEVFVDRTALLQEVSSRLKNAIHHTDIIQFLSIDQRQDFSPHQPFTLTTAFIDGAVMQAQEHNVQANQLLNAQSMLKQLLTTPSLAPMLDAALASMSHGVLSALDHNDTRVENRIESADETAGWRASMPLREVLLQFYLKQAWPAGQTRTFINPRHYTQGFDGAQRREDVRRWESLVEQTAGVLANLLASALRTWWTADSGGGGSRLEFCARVIGEKFRADLLLKRQAGLISAEESYYVRAIFVSQPQARCTLRPSLTINKLRINAPFLDPVDLASTLLISDIHTYLYTQPNGLQGLKDTDHLNTTLLAMLKPAGHQDELLNYLSINERSRFLGMETAQVSVLPVSGNVFEDLVADIVAKQARNMEQALDVFRRSEGRVDLETLLDCTLDVRALLDSRLLEMDTGGRWSPRPVQSDDGYPTTVEAERAKREFKALQSANTAYNELRGKQPTLRRLAATALNHELQLQKVDADANKVYINTYPTAAKQTEDRLPLSSVSLTEHFIARLAKGGEPVRDTLRVGFYSAPYAGSALRLNSLTSTTFNRMVEHAMSALANHDIRDVPIKFLRENQDQLSAALLQGLRSEVQMRQLNGTLSARTGSILDTVLRSDGMQRLKRPGLRGFFPDAYGLTLKIDQDDTAHGLANCFVLTERGGVDLLRSGQAVLWTPQHGHEAFPSLRALRDALGRRLAMPEERIALTHNLARQARAPHQVLQLGPLQRIDEHLLNNRQKSNVVRMLSGIDYWRAAPLSAQQLQDCLDHEMAHVAPSNLDRATAIAQAIIQRLGLPSWLGTATPNEQIRHAELLQQYVNSAPDEQDYLHDVPSLREHVASRLQALLKKRFPNLALSPDDILIPTRLPLNGRTLSLTDFALSHLPDLPTQVIEPISRTATALPPGLDGTAVVQMIFQLDTADAYRTLLTAHLTSATEDALKRKALFRRQLPWQLLRLAHEEKLAQRLSANAWSLVCEIFDMPDAAAREKVRGATAIIRPLELIASEGATPVRVLGAYLIGPKPPLSGPLVLYTPYRLRHVLQEFPQESDLLKELTCEGPLQDWVIRHIDAAHQATYQTLFNPIKPDNAAGVALGGSPVRGNVLTQLYEDNAEQLKDMLSCQFDTHGKDQWEGLTGLLSQGISTSFRFFAGTLQYPLDLWRSFKLFKASAEHLQQKRWTRGLKSFVLGVASMASLYNALSSVITATSSHDSPPNPTEVPDANAPGDTLAVTHSLRTQLQDFETTDVALDDLQEDPLTHVYSAPGSHSYYAPVAGKVYPVTQAGERWRIAHEQTAGPYVELGEASEWVLDLSDHHPRFGAGWSRQSPRAIERDEINIEATGMRDIAALSPWKARCITEAINVATYYAVNCKRNMLAFAANQPAASRVAAFLTEMFAVASFSPMQLQKIEHRIDEVLGALVNPTLMHPDSPRFVIGTARWDPLETYAFTLSEHRGDKIYLLNRFFDPMLDVYHNRLNAPFDITAHARATVLLHELSHLVSQTEDIAYLDSMRPFHDLVNVDAPSGRDMFDTLSEARETALSVLTPASQLFKTWDWRSQSWEDLGEFTSKHALEHVLRTTGTTTLDDARQVFMSNPDKRMDVILSNADSVAYMIAQVGRVLDPGA